MPNGAPRMVELGRTLRVLPSVLRAAARIGWLERRAAIPELVRLLRHTGGETASLDPHAVLSAVDAMLPVLPPFRTGRCLKRSLLLLDLWSRAGLHPALHLGYRAGAPGPAHGHAWVTTRREGLETFHPPDVVEVWRG